MKYIERKEVAELEDGGMLELLLLKNKIAGNETAQTEQDIETAGTQRETEELRTVNKCQELRIGQPTIASATVNDSVYQPKTTAGPQVKMQSSGSAQPQLSPHWRR